MDGDSDNDPFFEEESSSEDEGSDEAFFNITLQGIKVNSPLVSALWGNGHEERIQNMTDEAWEQLGRDISNHTHLKELYLSEGALNDHKMSFFFRGLTRSNSIKKMQLYNNEFSVEGVRSMVPFLQNANNLKMVDLHDNNILSEGINLLFRALRDSPIEGLYCSNCGIESIEIDRDSFPKHLKSLNFDGNNISADGCRGLAKLLQGADSTLTSLSLRNNKIDDERVGLLVDALQNNTSLGYLDLRGDDDIISSQGQIMLLQLVNNISSIEATLQSNHTLRYLFLKDVDPDELFDADDEIQHHIDTAIMINRSYQSKELAGSEKVIRYHFHSEARAELCRLQEVDGSLYSEIDPLHLPEVLALVGRRHGQGELYVALLSSIMTLFSTMDWEKYIQKQREYYEEKIAEYRAKIEELDAKLATRKEAAGNNQDDMESQSNKRRRT